jgi:hypothetical protein
MTTTGDYYDILGVPHNATPEQIKKSWAKLIRENHPDQFMGKRRQYEKSGDQDLLKILDEKIAQANERCKQINEAYNVLKDPYQREQYDYIHGRTSSNTTYEPPPRMKPEIVLSTTSLNFGTVTKGNKKTKTFTIDNRGGTPDSINISWESVPDWSEDLVFEQHPINIFPIKVTVTVRTKNVVAGSYSGRIVVTVDGEEYYVSVSAKVVIPVSAVVPVSPTPTTPVTPQPRPTPAPKPTHTPPPPAPTPTKIPWGVIIMAVVILVIIMVVVNSGRNQVQSPQVTTTPLPSQIPTLSNDQVKAEVSGLVRIYRKSFNVRDYVGQATLNMSDWSYNFQVANDSNWPIVIVRITQNPSLYTNTTDYQGETGVCGDNPSIDSNEVEGPALGASVFMIYGQNAHTIEDYRCSNTTQKIDAPIPENSMCIVFYPIPYKVKGDLTAFFPYGPPIIKCDQ